MVYQIMCGKEEGVETLETRAISFVVKLRSGGGAGKTLQLTVPKDVVEYLALSEEDYVRVAVHKLPKKEETT